ncbi:MAG: 2-phosphoglycerate kinase [Parcubacteria group bacterium]|nr:2-phosphoglycerate kinase [Parcubacteria group bacterium]
MSFILNLPWTIVGILASVVSFPKNITFHKKPFAFVLHIRSFWWYSWLPSMRGVRAMAIGQVVLLGPYILPKDFEHELVHVEQAIQTPFIHPILYFIESRKKGYRRNKYEVEAYRRAENVYVENKKIFIYGAPGVGKTTHSLALQKEFGYPLVEGDYLREVEAQKEKTKEEDPFVYVGTKEAWQLFGECNEENVIKGLKAVRKSMNPYVLREIEKHPGNLILEAAFLDPEVLSKKGELILVVTPDEEKHRSQYYAHRTKDKYSEETFIAARIIQSYLIEEAKHYLVKVILK